MMFLGVCVQTLEGLPAWEIGEVDIDFEEEIAIVMIEVASGFSSLLNGGILCFAGGGDLQFAEDPEGVKESII